MSARKSRRPESRSAAKTSTTRTEKLRETARARGRRHGQKIPDEVRLHALSMIASGMRPCDVAESVGVSPETLRTWRRRADADDSMPTTAPVTADAAPASDAPDPSAREEVAGAAPVPGTERVHANTAPHDPGQGLGEHERAAIRRCRRVPQGPQDLGQGDEDDRPPTTRLPRRPELHALPAAQTRRCGRHVMTISFSYGMTATYPEFSGNEFAGTRSEPIGWSK